jgi:hypothetical protein
MKCFRKGQRVQEGHDLHIPRHDHTNRGQRCATAPGGEAGQPGGEVVQERGLVWGPVVLRDPEKGAERGKWGVTGDGCCERAMTRRWDELLRARMLHGS